MSEPIVKGIGYEYSDVDDTFGREERAFQEGYCNGQADLISAGYQDMSHYRRRSPEELAADEEGAIILFKHRNNPIIKYGVYCTDIDAANDDDFRPFRTYDGWCYAMRDIEYWAYAYLPPEQNGKDEE